MSDDKNIKENTEEVKSLGIAGATAKAFITSPLSLLFLIAFLAVGILGLQITPRQEDPQISVPMVDIFVQYPGASVKEVESHIARPLEGLMSEITGVEHVYSASARGQAIVTVQFYVGQDFESSIVKLRDKLDANKDRMPRGATSILARPVSVDDVPVVTLTLWSNDVDDAQLRTLSMDLLQNLREESNTSQSFIVDGRADQVRVEILPERLATYGVSLGQVAHTIQMANSQRSAGSFEPGSTVVNIITGSFLQTVDDIQRLMVTVVNGRPVYVRDVANVTKGPSETNKIVGYFTGNHVEGIEEVANGAAAVTLAIAKKHGTNGVDVAEAILAKVETLRGRMIPDNVHVEVTRDYGASAKEKVNHLLFKLVFATGIVTVLVWLFLGWRASTVVLIVVPVVITTTVFSAWIIGLTIDRVSLFALIFSIGILVDDAIVVVENIYRRWLIDESLEVSIAVDAVREVGNPTIIATFTVIAALLPMGFVGGMMGPYMSPIPILGSVAMLVSLFAAFAFTPWLVNKLKPSLDKLAESAEKEHKQAARMEKMYRAIIIPLIRNKARGKALLYVIFGTLLLTLLLFYPTKLVQVKMLPLDNKPEFNVVVNFPEGTALPITANLINKLATRMQDVEEVTALQTYVGTASPFNFNGLVRHYYLRNKAWQGDIQVQLTEAGDRDRTSHEIADAVRNILTPIAKEAGARIQVVEMPPGPPVLQSVVAEIYGPSATIRRQVAKDITVMFEKATGLTDVDNFLEEDHKVLRFHVNADKAQRNGITVNDINSAIEMAMGGFVVGDIKKGALMEPAQIVMQVPLSVRSNIDRLAQLPITNRMGKSIPLSELVSFDSEIEEKPIYHKDLRPVEFVTGETTGKFSAPVYAMFEVQQLLEEANDGAGYRAPDGTEIVGGHWFGAPKGTKTAFEWGGEWTVTFITFRDMGIAFIGALILIYMLIVAQFGNFILPLIVMSPIPLTLIGIIPGHMIMGASFTATSMIGFIALAGIIVRNSILLVDFTRSAIAVDNMSLVDAVIHSCEARTRPIVITAFALIGGSLAILTDPIFQGMAVSLIFGGFVSTVLTLLVVPLGCISAGGSFGVAEGDIDPDGTPPPSGGSDKSKKPENSSTNSYDDETLMEKTKEGLSTVVGILFTVGGLVFTGVKGLLGLVFSFAKNKVSDKPIDLDEVAVTSTNESNKSMPSSKPVSWQEPWIKDGDESADSSDKVVSSKAGAEDITPLQAKAASKPKAKEGSKPTKAKSAPKVKAKTASKAKSAPKAKAKTASKTKVAPKAKVETTSKPKAKKASKASTKKASEQGKKPAKSDDTPVASSDETKNKPKSRRGIRLKNDI